MTWLTPDRRPRPFRHRMIYCDERQELLDDIERRARRQLAADGTADGKGGTAQADAPRKDRIRLRHTGRRQRQQHAATTAVIAAIALTAAAICLAAGVRMF